MRLVTFDEHRLGVLSGDGVRDVTSVLGSYRPAWPYAYMLEFLASFRAARPRIEELAQQAEPIPLDQVRLRAPISLPGKIVAVGANYALHHQEMGRRGMQGEVFLKASSSVTGPGGVIQLPNTAGDEVHYEAELAVVVGDEAKDLDESNALDCVLGYTTLLDITVRGKGDRSRRKSYETFTPIGPAIVTADEVPDPHHLKIRLWCNDELRIEGSTSNLIYGIPQILRYVTSVMTLHPGDIIATGTPDGVGRIDGGDRLTIEIDDIGRMDLTVHGHAASARPSRPDG